MSVRSDDEDILADQIVQEGTHSPADVIFTENSPALEYLQGQHLLAPVDRATLSAVNRGYNSPSGDWVGVSARVSVLVYNTRLLRPSELPKSVLDLGAPKWSGKLAIAPEETDFEPIVTAVAHAYGVDAARQVARGHQVERCRGRVRRQRDDHVLGQLGPGRDRNHQPVLLVQAESRDRRSRHALRYRPFRCAGPGLRR